MQSLMRWTGAFACLLALGAAPIFAGAITYGTYSDWSAATTGVVQVTIPSTTVFTEFVGHAPTSVTYSGVGFSISNGNLFDMGPGTGASVPMLSNQEATTGVYTIKITFPEAVTAFSLSYGTFDGGDVIFALSNGDTFTQGSTNNGFAVYLTPNFVGVTDSAFTWVSVTNNNVFNDALDISNIAYGSDASSGSVSPEPPSAWLFLPTACALWLASRRSRAGGVRP